MRKFALYAFGLVVTMLVALGLVVLSTASEANGIRLYHDAYWFMRRQFIYIGMGLVLAVIVGCIDYHRWRDSKWLPYTAFVVMILMLLAVFPPLGKAVKGSYRWISFGFFKFQPAEFAKILTVLLVAAYADRIKWRIELFWRGAMVSALIVGAFALPIMLEPDFGSTMVIGLVGFMIMFMCGVRILHFMPVAAFGLVALIYKVLTNPNRVARLMAFGLLKLIFNPDGNETMDEAAEQAAYQAHQALVAISNGGITGVGLGQSMQKHYYLPEAHTDFIFAIGAEELGLAFSAAALTLFFLFFLFCVYFARKATDNFGRNIIIGMLFIIFFQAMFNIGVVCEAFPTKGMALPFFSYGGTNMLSAFFAVGLIYSVSVVSYREYKVQREEERKAAEAAAAAAAAGGASTATAKSSRAS